MSDLLREAADYAELQMDGGDGGDGGGLRSARTAKGAEEAHARKGSFPPGCTAAGCSSPQSTGGAQDRRHSSLSAGSFPITGKSPDFVGADLERLSTHLSFDPLGDHSVLNGVRDTIHVSVERLAHIIMTMFSVSYRIENVK